MCCRPGLMAVIVSVLASWPQAAESKAAFIPLPEKVCQSHFIGRIRVLSTHRRIFPGEYRSIARVQVLHSIKGGVPSNSFELEFDNGLGCPNVHYEAGEECLI